MDQDLDLKTKQSDSAIKIASLLFFQQERKPSLHHGDGRYNHRINLQELLSSARDKSWWKVLICIKNDIALSLIIMLASYVFLFSLQDTVPLGLVFEALIVQIVFYFVQHFAEIDYTESPKVAIEDSPGLCLLNSAYSLDRYKCKSLRKFYPTKSLDYLQQKLIDRLRRWIKLIALTSSIYIFVCFWSLQILNLYIFEEIGKLKSAVLNMCNTCLHTIQQHFGLKSFAFANINQPKIDPKLLLDQGLMAFDSLIDLIEAGTVSLANQWGLSEPRLVSKLRRWIKLMQYNSYNLLYYNSFKKGIIYG